jgi:hypothetical protein
MKKAYLLGVIALLAMVFAMPVMAACDPVNLVQKDVNWQPVAGATGTFTYDESSFSFTGAGLIVDTEYTLISFMEPYPGTGSVVLGTAVADGSGNIEIAAALPALVYNTYVGGEYDGQTGAKIWLVPSAEFNGEIIGWTPEDFLFETSLIPVGFVCEDDVTATTTIVIGGSIAGVEPCIPSLAISTDVAAPLNFGEMTVGENVLMEAGNLHVQSQCTGWMVTAASSPDTEGYMQNSTADPVVNLVNPLNQKDMDDSIFYPVIGGWAGFDGIYTEDLWDFAYPLSFEQTVDAADAPGDYSITLTYTVTPA